VWTILTALHGQEPCTQALQSRGVTPEPDAPYGARGPRHGSEARPGQSVGAAAKRVWLPSTLLKHGTLQAGPKTYVFKPPLMPPLRGFNLAPIVYSGEYYTIRRRKVNKRFWSLLLVLSVAAMIAIAASATTIYSSPEHTPHPKLTVESCLVEGTDVFRIKAVNWDVPGQWRLKLHHGTDVITIGYLAAGEEIGSLDASATITTTTEGTWKKQFLEGDEWVNRHGAHSLSVEEYTLNGWFCPSGPTCSLGDRVWYDTDQDGIQDDGEPGVQGITVQFHDDPTCSTTFAYSRTTNLNGRYLFTDVTTSTVCLQFLDIPDGWQISLQDQGSDETLDSDADPVSARIENIYVQADDLDEDLGLSVDGSIGDRVWCDYDGNSVYDPGEGLDNITISLFEDSNCDRYGGEVLATVETGSEGYYAFKDLNTGPPGATDEVCYVVAVDTTDADLGTCSQPVGAVSLGTTLTADEFDNDAMDFSFREQSGMPEPFRTYCPLVITVP